MKIKSNLHFIVVVQSINIETFWDLHHIFLLFLHLIDMHADKLLNVTD